MILFLPVHDRSFITLLSTESGGIWHQYAFYFFRIYRLSCCVKYMWYMSYFSNTFSVRKGVIKLKPNSIASMKMNRLAVLNNCEEFASQIRSSPLKHDSSMKLTRFCRGCRRVMKGRGEVMKMKRSNAKKFDTVSSKFACHQRSFSEIEAHTENWFGKALV